MNENNQKVKIIYWDKTPFEKHKKTIIGTIVKEGQYDIVIDIGSKAIIIPYYDILHIQEIVPHEMKKCMKC